MLESDSRPRRPGAPPALLGPHAKEAPSGLYKATPHPLDPLPGNLATAFARAASRPNPSSPPPLILAVATASPSRSSSGDAQGGEEFNRAACGRSRASHRPL
jgi:hypothetical protein